MTTRELLIQEINQAPEDVLQMMLRYLQAEQQRRTSPQRAKLIKTTGSYAEYWNQFIGALAEETWDRPPQGNLEQHPAW
jgi:hypothetical protein